MADVTEVTTMEDLGNVHSNMVVPSSSASDQGTHFTAKEGYKWTRDTGKHWSYPAVSPRYSRSNRTV